MRTRLFCAVLLLAMTGCYHAVEKPSFNPFPLRLDFKSFTVINQVPLRRGENLDYLLELDKWAHNKIVASGSQGEAVLSLIEGRVNLEPHPTVNSLKRLNVDVIFSFEFKNQPLYGKGKMYFRISEQNDLTEEDVPEIRKYIDQKLNILDQRLLSTLRGQFPALTKNE